MKKLYTLLAFAFSVLVSNAQIVTIPDANFKAKLLAASPSNTTAMSNGLYVKIDLNEDNEIQLSESVILDSLSVYSGNISDLTGISSFTNLKGLNFDINQVTSVDLSGLTALKSVFCRGNQLTNLDLTANTNLENLYISGNPMQDFDFSYLPNLKTLTCGGNGNTSFSLAGYANLREFNYSTDNQLTSLSVNNCNNLKKLNTAFNPNLSAFSFSGLENLTHLSIPQCAFSNLDLTPLVNLRFANLEGNNLQTLDVTGLNLMTSLHVYNNQLTNLDVSTCTSLTNFSCHINQLETLNIKNGSSMTSFNISSNPNLSYVCTTENRVNSIQSMVNALGYDCHVNSYCSFTPGGIFYTIQGNNRYDSNNDGCQANDIAFPNLKFGLTDGINTGTFISNGTGSYSIPVQSGTHTLSPILENPTYYNASSATVTFPTESSPFIQDFCITANGTHNDLEVALLPVSPARPGFDAHYKIIYKNKGNTTQSGALSFSYDDTILQLVSANPSISSQGTDILNWNFTNLQPFETREISITLNLNSPLETPPVNAGNGLLFSATAVGATDETADDNVSNLNQTVVNSFDPNDKTCIEGTWLPISEVGKYVHYVIRFENTGTFAAENIVVKDMIDTTKFDIASLIPQSSSHPFVTRISGTNKVEFIFENINLPFDDANNDGYVAFKIKTKPTLVEGNIFSNSANIYFDYNAPIVTDTYTTTVFNPLSTNEFDFNSVFSLSPVPTKDVLTITTKETVTMSSISIYNILGQLVQVITNPNETIDVSGLQSGSYFIKIISDKGSSSSKFIKE